MSKTNHMPAAMSVSAPCILRRCASGDVVKIQQFLQKAGLFEIACGTVQRSIATLFGRRTAKTVAGAGLEKLHEIIPADGFVALVQQTEQAFARILPRFYRHLLRDGFAWPDKLWMMKHPIMRFFAPVDAGTAIDQMSAAYARRKQGRLTTLPPHRDSWYDEPDSCINIWLPLSRIIPGNGISIFPRDYHAALRYIPGRGVTRDQPVTRPENFTMEPGDALLFHANQLHSSELNHTDNTRCVLSLRIALDVTARSSRAAKRYQLVDPRHPLSFLLVHRNKHIRKLAQLASRAPRSDDAGVKTELPDVLTDQAQAQDRFSVPQRAYGANVLLKDLPVGVPVPVSEEYFLVRIHTKEGDRVWRMRRRCPHEGADLSLGFVDGQTIRCPWHNLPINITTGESACRTLGRIDTHQCRLEGNTVSIGG